MAKIVFSPKMPPPIMDRAREMVPAGFEFVVADQGTPEFDVAIRNAEYYMGFARHSLGADFYKAAPQLKLIQLISAGYDRCDLEAARKAKVPISNNGGANSVAVAEHTMLLMLAVARRAAWHHNNVVTGKWRVGDFASHPLFELEGKTLGIIGLGTIGKKVVRRALGFGLRIVYYDVARLTEDAEDALGVRFVLLPELLRTSDIVSLHVPLSPATRHLISTRELECSSRPPSSSTRAAGPWWTSRHSTPRSPRAGWPAPASTSWSRSPPPPTIRCSAWRT